MTAIQDLYPDELAHCFGCGRLNEQGYRLRSVPEGEGAVARFTPRPYHTAVPGFVNGGVLASLIDCHATGMAAIAAYRAEGRALGSAPAHRFVTASLKVDFLKPTPLGPELTVRGRARSVAGRKVVVDAAIEADDVVTVRGEVVCVELPGSMRRDAPPGPP